MSELSESKIRSAWTRWSLGFLRGLIGRELLNKTLNVSNYSILVSASESINHLCLFVEIETRDAFDLVITGYLSRFLCVY